ncbi:radical SAM domain-containing protein [Toxoplasma gondii CAST]|uniref:Radical SAM domain-containing protein n=1 Tax=Toxoplasma gondii CAST TaxID=943122 RepID=A0A425HTQ4_TOXGO|nr:radical SAM domain-containing protein [Toxoplasma gondii CAST]
MARRPPEAAREQAVDLESGASRCSSQTFSESSPAPRRESRTSVFDASALLSALDGKTVHAQKIWRYVVQKNVQDFREIPDLPRRLYATLAENFCLHASRVLRTKTSRDRSTTKLLLEFPDGSQIETCIMRYGAVQYALFPESKRPTEKENHGGSIKAREEAEEGAEGGQQGDEEEEGEEEGGEEEGENEEEARAASEKQEKAGDEQRLYKSNRRATVCLSAQVGCQMGCTFCATGTMGKKRNLAEWEILEQLYHASRVETIRNIVFMGMGEPLDNYNSVVSSIRFMTQPNKFAIGGHRVCISTVGLPHKIRQLASDLPACRLALSLHAPDQPTRLKLMPRAAAGWKLERVLEATDEFVKQQKRLNSTGMKNIGLLVEYIMIQDVNDTLEQAHALGRILQPRADAVIVNLIPYNPTDVPYDYKPSTQERVDDFLTILRKEYAIKVLVRQTLGQDIDSACGQLVVRAGQEESRGKMSDTSDESEDESSGASPRLKAEDQGSTSMASGAEGRLSRTRSRGEEDTDDTSADWVETRATTSFHSCWQVVKERIALPKWMRSYKNVSSGWWPTLTTDADAEDEDDNGETDAELQRKQAVLAASLAAFAGVAAAGVTHWILRRARV